MKKMTTVTMALSIAITGASLTVVAGPANAVTSVIVQSSAQEASKAELLQRINAYRAENGLSPVSLNTTLGTVAQAWSDKTATAGTFKHNPDFATQVPPGYSYVSEIIAAAETPEEIMYGWINSESHNSILLEAKATEVGIGYAYQGMANGEYFGNYYATAVFADYSTQNVLAIAPTFGAASFTIPETPGVQYRKGSTIIPAGNYPGYGTISITAEAKTGYNLIGPSTWTNTFPNIVIEPTPTPTPVIERFIDINPQSGFYKEIIWLADRGITTGWADGTFRPYESTNRDTMAAFLYRFAGSPAYTPPAKSRFVDVNASSPFYKEISWLAAQGISTGWADGTFRPSEPISRDAMAAFLYRFDQKNLRP